MKGRCGDTDVASLDTSPDNVKTKIINKVVIQVNIRGKKEKYMSMLRTRKATPTQGTSRSRKSCYYKREGRRSRRDGYLWTISPQQT